MNGDAYDFYNQKIDKLAGKWLTIEEFNKNQDIIRESEMSRDYKKRLLARLTTIYVRGQA